MSTEADRAELGASLARAGADRPLVLIVYQLGFVFDGATLHVRCVAPGKQNGSRISWDDELARNAAKHREMRAARRRIEA